jgi:exonuclease SbcC
LKSALRQVEQESENLKKLYEKLTSLKEQRHNLLGEDDPEKVRDSMKKERFRLENDLKKIEEEIANLKADLNTTKGVLLTKNSTLGERKQEHLIAREKFDVRLKDAGFLDYRDFTDAVLGQQRIKELQALKTDLEKRETQIVTRIKDTEQKIAVEMVKKMTESSIEDIQKEIAEQETQQQQIQRQLGAIEATVRQQDILRERQADLIDKISLQQKECTRWNYLNELIGSSDGKKFRRFAQGLTLDNLIGLANRHLLKLNDRYFLKRTENEELGIEVIDTYQADVTRPVSTLSGGEAFLASLALALGLSNIAGRKASIDSFFLDEGFGTLDPETLEVALAALDSLHASGKTIGIISHVEAIKERIPVQIMVRKLSGGVSTLEISG